METTTNEKKEISTNKEKLTHIQRTIELLIRYAKLDKPEIYHILGEWYLKGRYVKKNSKKAFSFFEKASEGGVVEAMYKTAIHYHGDQKYREKAYRLFVKAALNGHKPAAEKIAEIHANNTKKENNRDIAALWKKYAKGTLTPLSL